MNIFSSLANFLLCLFCCITISAQGSLNTTYLGHFDYGDASCSNLWGYAANNREYAIVGTSEGISVVEVTNPSEPVERGFIAGGNTTWREIKTFGHYAYVVEEQVPEGLVIIDLSQLPDTVTSSNWYGSSGGNFTTAHALFIDEPDSMLYIFGANYGEGGAIIASLANDPENPELKGVYDNYYIHDGYARNDTLWAAEINDGQLEVLNVADPANITLLGSVVTPSAFTHNCWLSDDGKVIFTTDEKSNAYIASYDVSDVTDIKELDRVQSNPGSLNIPHNTYVVNTNYIVTSCYTDGIVIHDVSDPSNMVQIGYYDTCPLSGNGFDGAWGVYAYLPSGNILISDIQEGLFIVDAIYAPAARLKGTITNATTGEPLVGVAVAIENGSMVATNTNFTGNYATGTANAGTYTILLNKVGYQPLTINGVDLSSGLETILDTTLIPLPSFTFQGRIIDEEGNGIDQAMVSIGNQLISYDATTNVDGYFSIPSFLSDVYHIYAGKWGYHTLAIQDTAILLDAAPITLTLEAGYEDDFALDYGWVSSGTTALGGEWELGEPIGTGFDGFPGNFNPELDVADDLGDQCYSTGNDGDFLNMVDGGTVTLTSPPMDLGDYDDAYLSYQLWFVNLSQVGLGTNDSVRISLVGDSGALVLQAIHSEDGEFIATWKPYTFHLNDFVLPTGQLRLRIEATADFNQFQLLEVAFDAFSVVDSADIVSVKPIASANNMAQVVIAPNPSSNEASFSLYNNLVNPQEPLTLRLFDAVGRQMAEKIVTENTFAVPTQQWSNGVYFYQLLNNKGNIICRGNMVVQR